MRRSAKWFGFVVAAALLGAACGGESAEPAATASADTATADTTAEGDRDRNVKVGGWGADGSGIASTVLRPTRSTEVKSAVFRRERYETVSAKRVLNVRDVFVTARVVNYDSGKSTETVIIAGFQTTGDDVSRFPIAQFGEKGVVRIQPTVKDEAWAPNASAWTIVSRDLLALMYDSNDYTSNNIAMIEYYDLANGKPATNYGTDGRAYISREVGLDWVSSFALRSVDEAGVPSFVVAGSKTTDAGVDEYVVAGVTANGQSDPNVGDEGSGRISLTDTLTAAGAAAVSSVDLADPGVGGSAGAIGLVARSFDKAKSETTLIGVVMAVDATTGKISMASSKSFTSSTSIAALQIDLRYATFSKPLALTSQIDSWSDATGDVSQQFVFDGSGVNVADNDTLFPTRPAVSAGSVSAANDAIVNVANEREVRTQTFTDSEELKSFIGVCFARYCERTGSHLIDLTTIDAYDGVGTRVSSMVVDSTGVGVALRNTNWNTGVSTYSSVSFDATGAIPSKESPAVRSGFDVSVIDPNTDDLVERVSDGVALDGSTLVGMRSQYANNATVNQALIVETVNGDTREVKLTRPMGVSSYSSDSYSLTRIDSSSVGVVAYIYDSATGAEEKRMYKVNAANGSIDTAFGTNGYVAIPVMPADDECGAEQRIISGEGVVAHLEFDFDIVGTGEDASCNWIPVRVKWKTFTVAGAAIGSGLSSAETSALADWSIDGWSADLQGNLYVIGGVNEYDAVDRFFIGQKTLVAKYRPDGSIDTSFGANGITTLEDYRRGDVVMVVDGTGRVYVAEVIEGDAVVARVTRLTTTGMADASTEVNVPDTTTPPTAGNSPAERRAAQESSALDRRRNGGDSDSARIADSALPANDGLTIVGEAPVLTSVTAVEDRSLTVAWSSSVAAAKGYVTATAMPSGRSCTSDTGTCIIRGLDPTETYTVSVAKKGDTTASGVRAAVSPAKPVVSLKAGRIASPTTFVRPASKGKATWKVRGGCTLNETNTRLTAPKSPGTCQLSVTTAKSGSTPKTTKSVTIVVKK